MNNTKKSKFQQRLEVAAKKRLTPEEDRGSMNDELKLHNMCIDEDDMKLYSIKDIDTLIQSIEEKIIPANEMPQTGKDAHLGYNTAIRECVTLLKRVNRMTKLKLHNTQEKS